MPHCMPTREVGSEQVCLASLLDLLAGLLHLALGTASGVGSIVLPVVEPVADCLEDVAALLLHMHMHVVSTRTGATVRAGGAERYIA